jgi:hypothetical protein
MRKSEKFICSLSLEGYQFFVMSYLIIKIAIIEHFYNDVISNAVNEVHQSKRVTMVSTILAHSF